MLFAGLLVGAQAHAADLIWTNAASGNWGVAANWSPNQVPGSTDHAFITNGGTYVVTVNTSASAASLQVGGNSGLPTLSLPSSTLTLSGASRFDTNATFAISGGVLTGSGDVTVAGTLNWSGGGMSGSGRTIIASGATLTLNNTTHDLNRVLQNDGTATWTAGVIQMNGGAFTNNGSFTANSGATLNCYGTGGVNSFNNAGTFTKQGGGTTQFYVSSTAVTFNNSGVVEVQGGTLAFNAGGSNSSSMLLAAGAGLGLAGGVNHAGTSAISGAGTVNITGGNHIFAAGAQVDAGLLNLSGGTVSFEGNLSCANVNFSSGTLTGSGEVTVTGTLNWSGGTMSGSGRTIIASGATLTLNNTTHDLNRVLQNDGTATWTAGVIQMNGGTLTNNGSFTANSGTTLNCYGTGGVNSFNNAGTFTKQGGGTTQFYVSSTAVTFNNNGVVDVQGGTLAFSAGGSNSSSILVAAGAFLGLSGNYSHAATSAISGPGTVNVTGGSQVFGVGAQINAGLLSVSSATVSFEGGVSLANLDFASGNLTGPGDVMLSGGLTWSGGTMSGSGRTIIASGATLTLNNTTHDLNRVLQNDGTATWTAGVIQMNGGTLTNNGSFTVNSGTTLSCYGTGGVNAFNNAGTFVKLGAGIAQFFYSSSAAPFNNSGTVDVQAGTLALNSSGTHVGDFAVTNGATLGFNGGHTLSAAVAITGTGNLSVAGGTLTDAGTVNVGGATFSGGTASFSGSYNGGSLLTVNGGTVNFNGLTAFAPGVTVDLSGGAIGGSGVITVTGALNWSGGGMSGSGRTIIANGATLTLNNTTHDLNRVLQNDGTATWTAGVIQMNGGTLTNNGSFTANSGATLSCYGTGGVNAFNNAGTFVKLGAGIAQFFYSSSAAPFNNSGTVDVQAGTLALNAGGTHGGDFAVANGATLGFNGGHALGAAVDITGTGNLSVTGGTLTDAGTVTVGGATFSGGTATFSGSFNGGSLLTVNGGTVNFNGPTAFAPGVTVDLSGGAIGGSGVITVTGALNWTGGGMSGSGRTIIASGATLTLNNTTHDLNRVLQNDGTATWTAGVIQMNGGTLTNNGSFTVNSGTTLSCYGTGGVNAFNNAGTFVKLGAGTAQFFFSSSAAPFNNNGVVDVSAGSLTLNSGFTQTGGELNLNGGTIAANSTLEIQGGVVRGVGTIAASVNNGGSISPGASPGLLTITGNYSQTTNGVLNIELAGNVPGASFDLITVGGAATLAGTLNVTFTNSFQPATNSAFTFLSASSRSGSFGTFNYPSNNVGLQVTYSGTSATIQEVTVPFAPTVYWVGGSGNWNTESNWSTGTLPGPNDDVLINVAGDVAVTHSSLTHSVRSLYSQNLFILSGGTLTVSNTLQVNNGLTLSGGTLRGATLMPGAGGQGITGTTSGGTLDGVTVNGTLDVGNLNSGASLTVVNGLVLNGTAMVGHPSNQNYGAITFTGTQTLSGNGTVVFGNNGSLCNALRLANNGTALTIGAGITVRGHSGRIGYNPNCWGGPQNHTVINLGTITADTAGGNIETRGQDFVNQGMLAASSGGTLGVLNLVGNVGSVALIAGSTLSLNGTYTNNLSLNLTTNAVLSLGGNWVNTGTINATNATVNLGGNFTLAGLGQLNRIGGTVNLTGILDGSGGTLALDAVSGSWVVNNGTLRDTVLSATGGAQLIFGSGTLDGVTVNGALDVGNLNNGASLTVVNGLVLNGTALVGHPSNQNYGGITFTGTQTLSGNGTVVFGNNGSLCNTLRLANNGTALTIGAGITVRGHSGRIGYNPNCWGGPQNHTVINLGTITADTTGGTIETRGESFVNQGLLAATNGGSLSLQNLVGNVGSVALIAGSSLSLNGSYTNNSSLNLTTNAVLNLGGNWVNTGTINATNATVNLGGNFTLAGLGQLYRVGGTVNLTGVLDGGGGTLGLNVVSGSWVMNNGTVRNTVLSATGGAQLIFGSGTLDGVTVNGALDVGNLNNGASLTVVNGLVLNGTVLVGHPSNQNYGGITFTGTQTLSGNGTVVFGNNGSMCNALRLANNGTALTIGAGITVRGHSGRIGYNPNCWGGAFNHSVTNLGTITADTTGGTIETRGESFVNLGLLAATNGGSLSLQNLVGNVGSVALIAGSSLSLNGNYTNNLVLNLTTNAVLNLSGTWVNTGSIHATNATVNLGGDSTQIGVMMLPGSTLNLLGSFPAAQVVGIQYSPGAVRLGPGGVVDNAGHTLLLDGSTGSWLLNGGTLRGGVFNGTGGAQLIIANGTLDGVTVNGTLDVGNLNNGASLTVVNGLVLNGTALVGHPSNQNYGGITFSGTQTLSGSGTVVFGNNGSLCNTLRLANNGTALTIGAGITVRGHSGRLGYNPNCWGGAFNHTVTNLGTITADTTGGTIETRGESFANLGILYAQKGTINLHGVSSLAGGTLSCGITGPTDYGRINSLTPLSMQGTLKAQFTGFYRPASGSSFTLLTYPSRTGVFDALELPADMQWQTTNGPTAFAVTATALLELPSIAVAPLTQSLVVGSNATLNVAALGTQPLAYQWRWNATNLTDGGRLTGTRSNTLIIANLRSTDAGGYRVVVTNAFGAITSSVATLTPLCIIAASNHPPLAGTVAGAGVFAANTTNVVTANPSGGYKFAYWTDGVNVLSTNRNLATLLDTNRFYVAIYQEANPLHVVTTATSPTNLAALPGGGSYTNGQSFTFSAPVSVTNPPNLFTFREWRANGAFAGGSASFTKTFSTLDPTNLQFVAHYDMASILPLITGVTINLAQPVPATTNFQLSLQFNRSMNTNFTPLVLLTNAAGGSGQPVVPPGGTWSAVGVANDTFTPPPITFTTGMDGTNHVFVSLARDLDGGQLALTNVLQLRVDVTPPPSPTLSLTASNSASATVSWSGYVPPGDLASFRVFLATSNFTSVAGRTPVSGVGAATRQFSYSGLALDQPYYAAVSAVDLAGNSSPTVTPLPFSLPSSTPPPVAVQVQAAGPASALVSWNSYNTSSLFGFAGFRLYYETNSFTSVSNLTARQTLGPGVRSLTIDHLDRTRTYYIAVVGFNGSNGFNANVAPASWSDPLAGNIGISMTIGGPGQTVDILQSITLVSNAVITVPANTTLRFAPGAGLTVQQGALNADGSALDPIVFTSVNDQLGSTPAAGDWAGITLGSGASASVLRHVFIKYAAGLALSNCTPTVQAFTALYNTGAGLNLIGSASLTTADALLAFNSLGARQFNTAQLIVRNSVLKNNGTNAHAAGSASLIATQNWWGSAVAGEVDATVQGGVVRSNFLVAEPLLTPAIGTANNVTQTGSRDVDLRLACRTAEAMRLSEDSTFAGVFFSPFTNAARLQLSEGGGVKTVFAQFRSLTGQTSAPVNVALTYVTTGPTIGAFSLTEGQVLNRPLLVTGTASAPLGMAAIEFYVDNLGQATNAGGGFAFSFDVRNFNAGVHRVKLLARDTAGNFATLERNVVLTPVPPPAPSITVPPADLTVNTNALRVAGTAEPLVEVRLFRSGTILGVTNASAAGTFSFANVPLAEGLNPLTALAIDSLGSAGSAVRTVWRDTVPPVALILDPPVYTYGAGLRLTWRFAATGKRATSFQVFWHTAPITNTNQASGRTLRTTGALFTVQGLATANYYFYLVGYDDVGNASPLSSPVQFLYDGVSPAFTVTYDKPSPVGVGPLRVTLAGSEPVSGVPSTTIQLNGGAPVLLTLTNVAVNTFAGTINVTPLLPSGPATLNVSALDTAGNPFNGPPSGPALSIDVRAPSGAITTAPVSPVQATNDTAVAVNLRLTEAPKLGTVPTLNFGPPTGTNVSVALTGSDTNWNGTLTVTSAMGSGVGHFTLSVTDALDNVGNSLTAGSALELYNTELPSPPSQPVGFQVASLSGGRVQLTWLAVSNAETYRVYSELGTNLVAPTLQIAEGVSSNSFVDLPAADGYYRYVVTALRRGAESPVSIVRVALSDRTPPAAPANVALQLVAAGLQVGWQAGAGPAPDHYKLYRNGAHIRTVGGGTTAVIDTPPRGVMNYIVAAVDALGNEALSAPAGIELPVGAVADLQALVNVGGAPVLSWISNDPTAVAFNIYRNGIKQNATPLAGTSFADALPPGDAVVTYAVRAVNATNAESAARTVEVYSVDLGLVMNPGVGSSNAPMSRYFDNYAVSVSNLTAAGALPLRQLELRRTSAAGPFNLVSLTGTPVGAGGGQIRELAVPCATDNSPQTVRLRAVQETDAGGSSVIYERTFNFATVQSPGVMLEVSANTLPLAGGLNSFDVRIFNRGYTMIYLATTRANGADPGDLAIVVRNPQGQEVSRQAFTGAPPGIIFSGGVGYVPLAPGASFRVTVPDVLVPEALASNLVTFEAVVSTIYDRFSAAGQQQSGPLNGTMQSSLAQTPYYGTAQTDHPLYNNDQPILITGQALDRLTGLPRANVALKLGFATRGYRWYRDVTTDGNGNYSYTYNVGPGLAGSLSIWAAHPDVVDQLNQAQIQIYRIYAAPSAGDIRMSKNDTLGFSIVLFNPGDEPLTNFSVDVQVFELQGTNRVPTAKVTGALLSGAAFSVAAGQRQVVNLQLAAVADAPEQVLAVFTFTSAEGAAAVFTGNVSLLAPVPIIAVVDPGIGYLEVSLDRGKLLSRTVTIVNRGLKDLKGVTLLPPTNQTWMVLNLPAQPDGAIPLPDLSVGGSNSFTVVFAPPADTPLGFHQDKILIRGTNALATFAVNLFARITSDQLGAVQFWVDNILGLDVPNATVRLRNTSLQVELPPVQTDINGLVTVTNLQEGDWSWQVNAPGHSANVGVVQVIPSQTVQVATRLNKGVVTVNFTVTPVPFTDRYEITLEQTFETHVPAPVLVLTPVHQHFENVSPGFQASYIITAKNEGLIQLTDLTLTGSRSDSATFTPLITYVPVLLPQEVIEIPFTLTYYGSNAPASQGPGAAAASCAGMPNIDAINGFIDGLNAFANAYAQCVRDRQLIAACGVVGVTFNVVTGILKGGKAVAGALQGGLGLAKYLGCILGKLLGPIPTIGIGVAILTDPPPASQSLQQFSPTGAGCFAGDTRVLLADGTLIPIDLVRAGDVVRSGPDRGNLATVTEVYHWTVGGWREIHFARPGQLQPDVIRTTDEHLFWDDGRGWVAAADLQIGSWLVNEQRQRVRILSNQRFSGSTEVYTLKLSGDTAFYANGVLVHDLCGEWGAATPVVGLPPGATVPATIPQPSLKLK